MVYRPAVVNSVNSMVGVGVLAVPFVMMRCGILLGCLLVAFCGWVCVEACDILVLAARSTGKKSYEEVAGAALGARGKLACQIFFIWAMCSACVAWFVVLGDMLPRIAWSFGLVGGADDPGVRVMSMTLIAAVGVLPLSLLNDVMGSIAKLSSISLAFYLLFTLWVVVECLPAFFTMQWAARVTWWAPSGLPACLPIVSAAMTAQTQLFMMFQHTPNNSPNHMSSIMKWACATVAAIYTIVGVFGYIHFVDESGSVSSGNLLNMTEESLVLDFMSATFAVVLVFSFPLVVFPCREMIWTLIRPDKRSRRNYLDDPSEWIGPDSSMPPHVFYGITVVQLAFTLVVAICVPNIETFLVISGATGNAALAFHLPGVIFLALDGQATYSHRKGASGRLGQDATRNVALFLLCVGAACTLLGGRAGMLSLQASFATDSQVVPTNAEASPPPLPQATIEASAPAVITPVERKADLTNCMTQYAFLGSKQCRGKLFCQSKKCIHSETVLSENCQQVFSSDPVLSNGLKALHKIATACDSLEGISEAEIEANVAKAQATAAAAAAAKLRTAVLKPRSKPKLAHTANATAKVKPMAAPVIVPKTKTEAKLKKVIDTMAAENIKLKQEIATDKEELRAKEKQKSTQAAKPAEAKKAIDAKAKAKATADAKVTDAKKKGNVKVDAVSKMLGITKKDLKKKPTGEKKPKYADRHGNMTAALVKETGKDIEAALVRINQTKTLASALMKEMKKAEAAAPPAPSAKGAKAATGAKKRQGQLTRAATAAGKRNESSNGASAAASAAKAAAETAKAAAETAKAAEETAKAATEAAATAKATETAAAAVRDATTTAEAVAAAAAAKLKPTPRPTPRPTQLALKPKPAPKRRPPAITKQGDAEEP